MRSAIVDLASQPIQNLIYNPLFKPPAPAAWSTVGWYTVGADIVVDGEPPGVARIMADGITSNRVTILSGFPAALGSVQVPPGVYTMSIDVKWGDASKFTWMRGFAYSTVSAGIVSGAVNFTSSPTSSSEYTRLSATVTLTAPANRFYFEWRNDANNTVAGDVGAWVRRPMVVQGKDTIYGDGYTPGWKWLSTPDNSQSVGYPYTLESIAGRPLASLSAAGSSAPLGLDAYEGRTLYAVHDVIDTASNLATIATIGNTSGSGTGRMTIRTGSTGGSTIELRTETIGGSVVFSNRSAVRTVGRHVTSGAINQGLTAPTVTVDGVGGSTPTLTPGQGLYTGELCLLWLPMADASNVPIFAAAYRGEHDAETRRRITAWLARKYGAPVPAGY